MSDKKTLSENETAALRKLVALVGDDATIFDKQEGETIRKMIDLYKGFAFFGRMGTAARNIVIWAAAMLGAWFAFNEWVISFIRKAGH